MKDILLITPPFTQLNTPYPATAYLKGFLNTKGIPSFQVDLGIEVILELFSEGRLRELFQFAYDYDRITSENTLRIYASREDYFATIDGVLLFLQGRNQTLARQICAGNFLPQAERFNELDELDWAFGSMGMADKAKHLATLYIEDISDFIIECIDEHFGFSRYAERLGESANDFDQLYEALNEDESIIDQFTLLLLDDHLQATEAKLVCISVPFPGNLYSAFRCAQFIKKNYPGIKIAMGGGFPNTELRSVSDSRVFDFFDYITLDDGELPIELLHKSLSIETGQTLEFKRTFVRLDNVVTYINNTTQSDYRQAEIGTPDYSDLPLDSYISVIQITNPMHSLWSDGRWNKLTMAHGCYWGKCTFCDISLDYIKRYEPLTAKLLVDRMEEMIAQTGEYGFHFVDEAAPPALMRALSIEIIKRRLTVTWWTNIRFEKSFTRELCILLRASGCIAISGGLEVASDRLLALIDKGVTVEQVARVTNNLTESGIMVHSYLMYGYPTQNIQETVDSLEMVRQLFEIGTIQSGFWHQFALTTHSPIGQNPEKFGVIPKYKAITFADNDVQFDDTTGIDHSQFSYGLKKSLYNFMHGVGFDVPVMEWFDFKVPKPTIAHNFIESCLGDELLSMTKSSAKPIWLGNQPIVGEVQENKKGEKKITLTIHTVDDRVDVSLEMSKGTWLVHQLENMSVHSEENPTFSMLKSDYESQFDDFEPFWYSKELTELKDAGLLV
ncbi:MAG: hypothetical protein ACI865_000619 [Flavobacteriaceae bacterium]